MPNSRNLGALFKQNGAIESLYDANRQKLVDTETQLLGSCCGGRLDGLALEARANDRGVGRSRIVLFLLLALCSSALFNLTERSVPWILAI